MRVALRKMSTATDSLVKDALHAVIPELRSGKPTLWENEQQRPLSAELPVQPRDVEDAEARWARMRPLLTHLFPECLTPPWGAPGTISSPLTAAPALGLELGLTPSSEGGCRCYLKEDSKLAVCGSVKARGGLFEVLTVAESVARTVQSEGTAGDTTKLATDAQVKETLARQAVVVGSTGNLGLSVGLAGAALGMQATVHMSSDAKQWKKDLLRSRGANVVEHSGLYEQAVREGREEAACKGERSKIGNGGVASVWES